MGKILFICGSLNQTTIMHQVSRHLSGHDQYFSPYYADGFLGSLSDRNLLNFSILGGKHFRSTMQYLSKNKLSVDFKGTANDYDLVLTGSDILVPKNIANKRLILIQEGMMHPEGYAYQLVKHLKLPRFFADTAATGLSDKYDYFCTASDGYRDFFIKKGIKSEKLLVTGIPNFDNAAKFIENDFQYHNYVLVATSAARETFKGDNRKAFLKWSKDIAGDRQIIFRLHPNENFDRSTREIKEAIPDAIVFTSGDTNQMVANCQVLITQWSSVTFIGLALKKEVHSLLDVDKLRQMVPEQNGGKSAERIASICEQVLGIPIELLKNRGRDDYPRLKLDWRNSI